MLRPKQRSTEPLVTSAEKRGGPDTPHREPTQPGERRFQALTWSLGAVERLSSSPCGDCYRPSRGAARLPALLKLEQGRQSRRAPARVEIRIRSA